MSRDCSKQFLAGFNSLRGVFKRKRGSSPYPYADDSLPGTRGGTLAGE